MTSSILCEVCTIFFLFILFFIAYFLIFSLSYQISDAYPKFVLNLDENRQVKMNQHIFIFSLCLHFECVVGESKNLTIEDICNDMDGKALKMVKHYRECLRQYLLDNQPFNEANIVNAIQRAGKCLAKRNLCYLMSQKLMIIFLNSPECLALVAPPISSNSPASSLEPPQTPNRQLLHKKCRRLEVCLSLNSLSTFLFEPIIVEQSTLLCCIS